MSYQRPECFRDCEYQQRQLFIHSFSDLSFPFSHVALWNFAGMMTGKSVEFVSTLRKHLHLEQIPRPFRSQVAFPKLKITTHCLLLFLICFIFKHYHPSSSKGHIRLISPMLKQQTSLFMLLPLPALWQSIWVTGAMSLPFIDSTCVWYLLCPCISLVFVHFEQYTPIYIASLISLGIFFLF